MPYKLDADARHLQSFPLTKRKRVGAALEVFDSAITSLIDAILRSPI